MSPLFSFRKSQVKSEENRRYSTATNKLFYIKNLVIFQERRNVEEKPIDEERVLSDCVEQNIYMLRNFFLFPLFVPTFLPVCCLLIIIFFYFPLYYIIIIIYSIYIFYSKSKIYFFYFSYQFFIIKRKGDVTTEDAYSLSLNYANI